VNSASDVAKASGRQADKGANLFEPQASLFATPTDDRLPWEPAQRATAFAVAFFAYFLGEARK
jgi:hypothetical protein